MRIILLAAAAGAAALGGAAAAAQSVSPSAGRSGISYGSVRPAVRGHRFHVGKPFRPGPGRGHGRHRRHRGWDGPAFVHPWGAGGFEGVEAVDPHGTGFFAGAGGRVSLERGRPYYDYDRAYPYEWASAPGGGALEWRVEEGRGAPLPRCSAEKGVRVCRGAW